MTAVTCLQLEPPSRVDSFAERARAVAAAIAERSASDLIVLPEMWPTGYLAFDGYSAVAEPLDGPLVGALREAAAAAGSYLLAGSFVERGPDGRLHNTAPLIGPGGELLAAYRKIHTFGYNSREPELLSEGEAPCVVDTEFGRVGISICYDLRFPELYREQVACGAELLLVVASWPRVRAGHWLALLRARAIENQAFVVACGAAGEERGVELAGASLVVSPEGEVLAEGDCGPMDLEARISLEAVRSLRDDFPVLADRRIGGGARHRAGTKINSRGGPDA